MDSRIKKLYVLVVIVYIIGALLHSFAQTRSIALSMTPYLVASVGILSLIVATYKTKYFNWFVLIAVVAFFIEVLGVSTGLIFGEYQYGRTLGLKFLDVPVVIGLNWVSLLIGAHSFLVPYIKREYLIVLVPLVLVVFDYVMEPVAIHFDYWKWKAADIPLQNYLAWFLVSLLFSFLIYLLKIRVNSKVLDVFFFSQFLFFLIIHLSLRLFL